MRDPGRGRLPARRSADLAPPPTAGPLEVRPENDPVTETTLAYQRFYSHDENGDFYLIEGADALIGSFEFHPLHNHWHFENLARYALLDLSGNVISSSSKVSFCIVDFSLVDPTLEHSSGQSYFSCNQDDIQGLAVGWGDTYVWSLAGQALDITGVKNGVYRLVSVADPRNDVIETDDTNNAASVLILLRGNRVWVLD